MKICNKCKIEKSLDEFPIRSDTKKIQNTCKSCKLDYYRIYDANRKPEDKFRRRGHNISYSEFCEKYEIQNGRCEACHNPIFIDTVNKTEKAYVDHNHQNGKVRGLLCSSCNFTLGHVKDNSNTLINMINYLEEHNYD